MKRITQLTVGIASVAMLSLAACGSDDKLSDPALPGAEDTTLVDDTTQSGETQSGSDATSAQPTDVAGGSCHVTVVGDINAEWTSSGGSSSVGYGPWVGSPGVTTPIGALDESFFVINCQDSTDNYVGFLSQNEAKIPMEPATYVLPMSSSTLGSTDTSPIASLVTFQDSETNWVLMSNGELVITEFDDEHIAGRFTLPVTDAFAEMTGTSEGSAVITGEFDFENPN